MASLVDTNILVYRVDISDPGKRKIAREVLREGAHTEELLLAHQTVVEFMHAVTRTRGGRKPLLTPEQAWREAEDFIDEFPVLYPNELVIRTAFLGMAAFKFSWYDAHLWAYAEHYGLPEILSEDFEHGRRYGNVRVRNPFLEAGLA